MNSFAHRSTSGVGDFADPASLLLVVAVGGRVDLEDLLLLRHRLVLPLLEDLHEALAVGQRLLRRLVEVRAELGERRQLAVLGQVSFMRRRPASSP
jgi:hypothetical protein